MVVSLLLFAFGLMRLFRFSETSLVSFVYGFHSYFLFPFETDCCLGQFYLILFAMLAEVLVAYHKGSKWRSAFLLSLAIGIKIFPVLLLFWFVFQKDVKQLVRILICGVALLVPAVIVHGIDLWLFYVNEILFPAMQGNMGLDYLANAQSMSVFLKFFVA